MGHRRQAAPGSNKDPSLRIPFVFLFWEIDIDGMVSQRIPLAFWGGGSSLLVGLRRRSMQYRLQAGPSRLPPPSTSSEGSKAGSPGASELFITALPLGVTFVCLLASASSW